MGIWGTIAKDLVSAIPYVGPIIEGGIEAATAKKAANQQVAGGQRAMDIQNKVYQQQQQLMQPYYETGTSAMTTLGSLLGLPGGGGGAPMPQIGAGGAPAAMPFGSLPNDTQQGALTDPAVQPNAAYNQGGEWMGMLSQQQRALNPQSTTSYSTPQQHGSSVSGAPQIRMRAPSGEEELIPADQVAHYLQQGATVIGSA